MNYLLDTCVISELIKKQPNKNVIQWISSVSENSLFLSVFTIAEIHRGIEKLPESRKKNDLQNWVNSELKERFKERILLFTYEAAKKWGYIQSYSENIGKTMSVIDGFIASIAIVSDFTLVTRNTKDMEASGVRILNPWEY